MGSSREIMDSISRTKFWCIGNPRFIFLRELGFDFCKKRVIEAQEVGLGQFDFAADGELHNG
jgi:hypothetical protein